MGSAAFGSKKPFRENFVASSGRVSDEFRKVRRDIDEAFTEVEGRLDAVEEGSLFALADKTRRFHVPIVTPALFKSPQAREPSITEVNSILLLAFTPNVDAAWRQVKIPSNYTANPALHLHWTKTSDANEQGKFARWRISYALFNGISQNINVAPTVVEYEAAYADNGTTSRIVYRSSDIPLTGVTAGYYMGLKIEAITAQGTPMASEPALFSVDIMYDEEINR